MTMHTIRLLTPEQARERRAGLVDLLVDAVESGASVSFVWPMTRMKAEAWWDGALASQAQGERLILSAETDGRIDGSVQVVFAPQENQTFRADLAKMLVHRRARRLGVGAALVAAAEEEARRVGRTLLTLDTDSGSDGERLYARLGWVKVGEVPAYSTSADHHTRNAASFFYKQL